VTVAIPVSAKGALVSRPPFAMVVRPPAKRAPTPFDGAQLRRSRRQRWSGGDRLGGGAAFAMSLAAHSLCTFVRVGDVRPKAELDLKKRNPRAQNGRGRPSDDGSHDGEQL